MWIHGIYSFLEVLRHRLPDSREHMLGYIHIAYSMIALLYETVSAFKEKWMDCPGDTARYRFATENYDTRERETWSRIAQYWYGKAANKKPTVGRLFHTRNCLYALYEYIDNVIDFEANVFTPSDILYTIELIHYTQRNRPPLFCLIKRQQ